MVRVRSVLRDLRGSWFSGKLHPPDARDTASPCVDNRPLLVPGKPEVREYRAIYVLNDAEIGNFSDEIVITAMP